MGSAGSLTIASVREDVKRAGQRSTTGASKKATLASLYPSHQAFVGRFTKAVDALERAGYLLKPEAEQARQAATSSRIGR